MSGSLSVATALEGDLEPFEKLRKYELNDVSNPLLYRDLLVRPMQRVRSQCADRFGYISLVPAVIVEMLGLAASCVGGSLNL